MTSTASPDVNISKAQNADDCVDIESSLAYLEEKFNETQATVDDLHMKVLSTYVDLELSMEPSVTTMMDDVCYTVQQLGNEVNAIQRLRRLEFSDTSKECQKESNANNAEENASENEKEKK